MALPQGFLRVKRLSQSLCSASRGVVEDEFHERKLLEDVPVVKDNSPAEVCLGLSQVSKVTESLPQTEVSCWEVFLEFQLWNCQISLSLSPSLSLSL